MVKKGTVQLQVKKFHLYKYLKKKIREFINFIPFLVPSAFVRTIFLNLLNIIKSELR